MALGTKTVAALEERLSPLWISDPAHVVSGPIPGHHQCRDPRLTRPQTVPECRARRSPFPSSHTRCPTPRARRTANWWWRRSRIAPLSARCRPASSPPHSEWSGCCRTRVTTDRSRNSAQTTRTGGHRPRSAFGSMDRRKTSRHQRGDAVSPLRWQSGADQRAVQITAAIPQRIRPAGQRCDHTAGDE